MGKEQEQNAAKIVERFTGMEPAPVLLDKGLGLESPEAAKLGVLGLLVFNCSPSQTEVITHFDVRVVGSDKTQSSAAQQLIEKVLVEDVGATMSSLALQIMFNKAPQFVFLGPEGRFDGSDIAARLVKGEAPQIFAYTKDAAQRIQAAIGQLPTTP